MFDSLIMGFGVIFDPITFLYIALGTIGGVIVGAMPGMSASMAVVLGMTFSYALDPMPALAFLVAVYCSAITGGSITAILFCIPGTPSSATTTFDAIPWPCGARRTRPWAFPSSPRPSAASSPPCACSS